MNTQDEKNRDREYILSQLNLVDVNAEFAPSIKIQQSGVSMNWMRLTSDTAPIFAQWLIDQYKIDFDRLNESSYEFSQLNDDAKQQVLQSLYYVNTDYDWWDWIYEDAANAGLEITSFVLDYAMDISFTEGGYRAAGKIIENHGEETETYKAAKLFKESWGALVLKYSDGVNTELVAEENIDDFDIEANKLESEFTESLRGEYLKLLREDLEYRESDAAVIETIEANEYRFNSKGELI